MDGTLADELDQSHPEPQSELIEEASPPAGDGPTDRFGRPFDPGMHSTNLDGTPRLTLAGKLRVKRGGTASRSSVPPGAQPSEPVPDVQPDYAGMARLVVQSFIASTCMLGGDEWKPDDNDEKAALESAWEAYLRAKGVNDLPPGLILAIGMGTYSMKRFQRVETRTRLSAWWRRSRIRSTFARVFRWSRGARFDSRADRFGEDDVGHESRAGVRTDSTFVDDPRSVP